MCRTARPLQAMAKREGDREISFNGAAEMVLCRRTSCSGLRTRDPAAFAFVCGAAICVWKIRDQEALCARTAAILKTRTRDSCWWIERRKEQKSCSLGQMTMLLSSWRLTRARTVLAIIAALMLGSLIGLRGTK